VASRLIYEDYPLETPQTDESRSLGEGDRLDVSRLALGGGRRQEEYSGAPLK
jgi:hypothetical protein